MKGFNGNMKKESGFTLLETMIVIFLMVIISWVAIPGFRDAIDDKNLKVVGPIFEKSLQLARSEARKGSNIIRVSPLGDGGDWSDGWKIERIISADEIKLIRIVDALPGDPDFTSEDFNGVNPIEITPDGQANMPGEFDLSLKGCPDNVKYVYRLLLSAQLGRSVTQCVSE